MTTIRNVSLAPAVSCAGVVEGALSGSNEGVLLNLRVSPGARDTALQGRYGENAFKLRVASPPVDGKANAEVERFLAEMLGLSRSRVSVVKGAGSRDKVVFLQGVGIEKVWKKLAAPVG